MTKVIKNAAVDKYQLSLIKDVGDCIEIPFKEVTSTHSAFRTYVFVHGSKRNIKLGVKKSNNHFKVFRKE